MSEDTRSDIHYSSSLELVLKKSAEHFLCLSKAHDSAQRWTASFNTYLTIPTIVLSGLAGLGSVGSQNFLPFPRADILIGMVSFTCATLQTVSSYFAFSSRSANHKNASIQYAKLHQLLSLELSLPRAERMDPEKLLDLIKDETARLLDTAPQLPKAVLEEFRKEYGSVVDVSIPYILNGLEPVRIVTEEQQPTTTPRPPINIRLVPQSPIQV